MIHWRHAASLYFREGEMRGEQGREEVEGIRGGMGRYLGKHLIESPELNDDW